MHNNTINLNRFLPLVNVAYRYEEPDIQIIFESRRVDILKNNAQSFKKPTYLLRAAKTSQPNSLEQILLETKNSLTGPRILLIPCNIQGDCWVGILIEIGRNGNIIRSLYLDSMMLDDATTDPILQYQLDKVYPGCQLELSNCLQQDFILEQDFTSSGAYMIENLLSAAQNLEVPSHSPTTQQVRALHLKSLHNNKPDFYETFVERQRLNIPTLANATPVSNDISLLYRTMYSLHTEMKAAFPEHAESKIVPITTSEFDEIFNVVCDENGVLRLQLKDATKIKEVAKFLPFISWHEDKLAVIKAYEVSESIATLGVTAAYATGIGASKAYEKWRGAKSVTQGALESAGVLNPWILAPTIALSGAAWLSTYSSRTFADSIQQALDLYNSVGSDPNFKDQKLKEAAKILQAELGEGPNGASTVTKAMRWFGTSNEQYQFAELLLAQIQAKQQNGNAWKLFTQIYAKPVNKNFKAMSLIGQIEILSQMPNWQWKQGEKILSSEDIAKYLDTKIAELNHDYQDIINQYFNNIWDIYDKVCSIFAEQNLLQSRERFAEIRIEIDKILNFKQFHCLRHMEPHGKFAELVLTFSQALCHVLYEKHYKATQRNANDNPSDNEIATNILALNTLNACQTFIKLAGFHHANNAHNKYGRVANTMQEFIATYNDQCKQARDVRIRNNAARTEPLVYQFDASVIDEAIRRRVDQSLSGDPTAPEAVREIRTQVLQRSIRRDLE